MLAFGLASRNKAKAAPDWTRYRLTRASLQVCEVQSNPVRVGASTKVQSEKAALGQSYRRRVAARFPDKAKSRKAPCQRLNRQMFRGHYPALAKARWMPMQLNALTRHAQGDHGHAATRKRLQRKVGATNDPRYGCAIYGTESASWLSRFTYRVAITGRDALPEELEMFDATFFRHTRRTVQEKRPHKAGILRDVGESS